MVLCAGVVEGLSQKLVNRRASRREPDVSGRPEIYGSLCNAQGTSGLRLDARLFELLDLLPGEPGVCTPVADNL
jgi:hypothetical protein